MKPTKLCPILHKTIIIHNTIHDARVPHIGVNAIRDNDVIVSEFLPCVKNRCMMFNNDTGKCLYNRSTNLED
ncbi:MAG: hypothetical protein IJW86_03005 [Clostridia bacterium]|nr:hypothetical protein [Clostridia bacterium]